MLVLSRKSGEEIRVGDNIVVSVIRTEGQRVRLGIVAPRNIAIRRQELLIEHPDQIIRKKVTFDRKVARSAIRGVEQANGVLP